MSEFNIWDEFGLARQIMHILVFALRYEQYLIAEKFFVFINISFLAYGVIHYDANQIVVAYKDFLDNQGLIILAVMMVMQAVVIMLRVTR